MSDDTENDTKSRKVHITPPLPLPTHFTVLPSLYPNKPLSPVLYVLINDIPIYLTLDPSHPPHLSLLPLFMALSPTSPLQILASLRLAPEHYSLTMDGIAPYVDFWAPLSLAREVCAQLDVGKLFWDEDDPFRGLLGLGVDDAMSWDDGEGIGHNWLPPTSQLPRSAYSLASLMSTPITGTSIIQDNRFITTPLDHHIRTELTSQSTNNDHSKIRDGKWAEAWDDLLILTDAAWREYLAHPSTPPSSHLSPRTSLQKLERGRGSELLYSLLPQLPALLHSSQKPTYSFSLLDLHRLLRSTSVPMSQLAKSPKAFDLSSPHRIIMSVISYVLQYRRADTWEQDREKEERRMLDEMRYKARMGLSLAEHLGGVMMSGFLATHIVERKKKGEKRMKEQRKEREEKEGKSTGMYIWIERVEALETEKAKSTAHELSGLDDEEKKDDWSDMIHSLESRRGGSPPAGPPSPRPHESVPPPLKQLPRLSPSSRSRVLRDRHQDQMDPDLHIQHEYDHSIASRPGRQMTELPTPPQSPKVHTRQLMAPFSARPDHHSSSRSRSHSHSRSSSRARSRDFSYDSSSSSNWTEPDIDNRHQTKPRRNSHRSWTGARPQPNPQPLDKITQFQLGDLSDTTIMLSENGNGWQGYRMLGWSILLGLLLGYFQLF
ncbi:hypothetical protein IAT40_005087 [Kwoniella sp. CBS 6097]